jgi:hypothetical protein
MELASHELNPSGGSSLQAVLKFVSQLLFPLSFAAGGVNRIRKDTIIAVSNSAIKI